MQLRVGYKTEKALKWFDLFTGGVGGPLYTVAFGTFWCEHCGKIRRSEFPSEVRTELNMCSFLLGVATVIPVILLPVAASLSWPQVLLAIALWGGVVAFIIVKWC